MTHDTIIFKPDQPMPASDSASAPSRTIMLIHGMWSRPHVWQNFRHYFEARGYRVVTPTLRHHDIEPWQAPDPELATTSLLDYAADLEREIRLLDEKPILIGHSMGGTLAQILAARDLTSGAILLASAHCAPVFALPGAVILFFLRNLFPKPFWRQTQKPTYNVMRRIGLNGFNERDARNLYATLIPESGRAAFELTLWFLDRHHASAVDARTISCPMLMLTGTHDRLTPLSVVVRAAEYYGDKARLETLPGHAHWLPLEPGWQEIAERTARFIETEITTAHIKAGATEAAPEWESQLA
ncbi:MAG: alpha/beta hydrolase [Parvibaculum sp.]|nr:alpha/beta hydrolase [Parvibaculum sp.]